MFLWIIESYVLFAVVMIISSFIITIINFCLLRSSLVKLRKFADNLINVKVMRNGRQITIDSSQLRPGDIIYYSNQITLPCDSVLISGTVIVNESSLTGETIPISKTSIEFYEDQEDVFQISNQTKGHILFEGTGILQTKGDSVCGVVLRTGYTSCRGRILREMLYPKEIQFLFFRKGMYFLFIVMCVGIIAYLIQLSSILDIKIPNKLVITRFFDTALWMVPPALPIFFSVCQTVALLQLGFKNIIATNPAKIVVASDVAVMCFDKTGTLTQDHIDVYGYSDSACSTFETSFPETGESTLIQKCFATCHSLYSINGEIQGDSLDLRMFEFSKFVLLPDNENDPDLQSVFTVQSSMNSKQQKTKLYVLRTWDFESSLQRITCIIKDASSGETRVVMKGSPEIVKQFCIASSINESECQSMLDKFTSQGLRVIALASKVIKFDSKTTRSTLKRDEAEKDLEFLGLLVLENKLKPDTANVILRLKEAKIACKVISGDNILTTIECAKSANFFDGPFENNSKDLLVCETLSSVHSITTKTTVDIMRNLEDNRSTTKLAITGQFLKEFLDANPNSSLMRNLLRRTAIFSRFKPEQKAQIVYLIQTELDVKVGMIGDGANDCSAIKQADIGISFTKTDASYSSPFSYSGTSIECVEKILCQGRSTMQNIIDCYRYYVIVSVYKFIVASILIIEYSYLSSLMMIVINYVVNIPFLIAIAFTRPLTKLTEKPISNMLDIGNYVCMFGNIAIATAQFLIHSSHLKSQDWYIPVLKIGTNDEYEHVGMSNHIMFLAFMMASVFSCIALFTSSPTKVRIYQNKGLTVLLVIIFILISAYYLLPSVMGIKTFKLMQEVVDNPSALGVQYVIAFSFGTLMILYEELIVKKVFQQNRKFLPIPHPLEAKE